MTMTEWEKIQARNKAVIEGLTKLGMPCLTHMTDEDLHQFHYLCNHWLELTDSEINRRKPEPTEAGPAL